MIDEDRKRELRNALLQAVAVLLGLYAIILLAHAESGTGWRATWFLVAATSCLVLLRAWAIERFYPKTADIYVRILVLEYLPKVLDLWGKDPEIRSAWRFHEPVLRTLHAAPPERLQAALGHLKAAGYPSDPSIPASGLLSMVFYAVAGLALGIWLPTVLGKEFLALCDFDGDLSKVILPVRLPAAAWLGIVVLVGFKAWSWVHNRGQTRQVKLWFQTNLKGELLGILSPRFASRRNGFVRDTCWLANLLNTTVDEVKTLRSMWGLESRPGWLWRLKLSTVNERSLNQVLFLVGLWLSVALPPLFGVGCS